ncbi:MAG: MgtC/SapB family protein [Candidatus Paceibacterota bacterium]|jgi:putative Mg2+ transporter-C (MgtC) family protein
MIQEFLIDAGTYELFIRLVVAALLGLLIGTERSLAHKTAGMRTFSLIALAAALFAIIGEQVALTSIPVSSIALANVLATVISGIGFIGTGLIFLKHEHMNGLTTAAGLWATAGVGMACGLGYYILATFSAVLAIIILGVVSYFEEKVIE